MHFNDVPYPFPQQGLADGRLDGELLLREVCLVRADKGVTHLAACGQIGHIHLGEQAHSISTKPTRFKTLPLRSSKETLFTTSAVAKSNRSPQTTIHNCQRVYMSSAEGRKLSICERAVYLSKSVSMKAMRRSTASASGMFFSIHSLFL